MTVSQAQRFVERWRRILMPWSAHHTGNYAARALERSFLGIAVGPLIPLFLVTTSGALPLSSWPLIVIIPVLTSMLLSYSLSLRFRAACRLLDGKELGLAALQNQQPLPKDIAEYWLGR